MPSPEIYIDSSRRTGPTGSLESHRSDLQEDAEHSVSSIRVEFLDPDNFDEDAALAAIEIVHAYPQAYVSPHKHPDDEERDGEERFSDIRRKVENPDYKVAIARDQDNEVIGTAMLHYDPDRSHIVHWYLVGLSPEVAGQGLGISFLDSLAEATFNAPRYDGAEPQLIEIKVILNEGNYNTRYSLETAREFPPMFRVCKKADFIEDIGLIKRAIRKVDDDQEEGKPKYIPGAYFMIGIDSYIEYSREKDRKGENGNGNGNGH